MAERLLRVIGHGHLLEDPRYKTNAERVKHAADLDALIGAFIGDMTLAENMAFFDKYEVTVGPIYDIAQFVQDPHVLAREIVVEYPDDEMGTIPMHNVVPKMSATPGAIRMRAPNLGEHNGEILGGLGLSAGEIQSLADTDVIYAGAQRKKSG
jgi:crotonobetainyl-CoA:carnitine CoA-transferase CaiB-like acyl-CoA transferase